MGGVGGILGAHAGTQRPLGGAVGAQGGPWGGLGGPWELLGDTQGWLWGYGYLGGGLFSPHCGAQHQHFSPLIPPPQRHRPP